MRFAALALALLVSAAACSTRVVTTPTGQPAVVVTPMALPAGAAWGPGPSSLPAGTRMAVLDGDPTRAQLFTVRLWMPNDYRIPPHTHPAYEHITVISGVFHVGMGNTFNMSGNVRELRAGDFLAIAPNMAHFAHAAGETVIQLHGMGPWQVNYVNRADDPRR